MTTLFISDLHLEDGRPDITRLFVDFLEREGRDADALYILGDLFEVWIGDDYPGETGRAAAEALHTLAASTPVYYLHGNRDFLLGHRYAQQAGMSLLPDPTVIDLYGTPTVLTHGDTLCTDDHDYQRFRRRIRHPLTRTVLLALPKRWRLRLARRARDASRVHTGQAPPDIMDVNDEAVRDLLDAHGVRRVIHGHTHRPAIHELDGGRQRIVLGDWYDHGSVLRISSDSTELTGLT